MTDRLFGQDQSIFAIQVDEVAKHHLLETARWTKFLAILFMIVTCLMIVFGVIAAMAIGSLAENAFAGSGMSPGVMVFVYLFLFGLYIYPVIALYKFSKLMKSAVLTGNQHEFNDALRHQKGMYKYMGILTIIVLSLYGIAIVFGVIAAAIAAAA